MRKRAIDIIILVVVCCVALNFLGAFHKIRFAIQEKINPVKAGLYAECVVFENGQNVEIANLSITEGPVYIVDVPSMCIDDLQNTVVHLNVNTYNNLASVRAFESGRLFTDKYYSQNDGNYQFWENTYSRKNHFIYWPEPIIIGQTYYLDVVAGSASINIGIRFE